MGYLEGLLSGFTGRKRELELENIRAAELANQREARVFEALLNSPDTDIRSLAISGLLDSAQPTKRQSGLRGWMGQMEQSPWLPRIQQLMQTPVATEEPIHGPQEMTGYLPQAPRTASLPDTNVVEPGMPPPTPVQPDIRAGAATGPVIGVERGMRPRQVFRTDAEQMLENRRAQAQGDIEGEVAGLVAAGFSEPEARELVKQNYLRRTASAVGQTFGEGNVIPDPSSPTGYSQLLYLRADPTVQHRMPAQPPTYVTATRGADREAVTTRLFPGQRYGQLTTQQAMQVDREVLKYQQELRQGQALGTELGQFQAPMDAKTAQDLGVPTGTTSAQLAGQKVPTMPQQERRRNAEDIKTQLAHIKTLLSPLPRKGELGSMLPGAVIGFRRRVPAYREQFAQLESAINNIRAVLTRTMQANVGTETERDAQRALTTLANIEGSLLDPASGDTQESAGARIDETMAYLDQILSTMPAQAVPQVGAPPPSQGIATPGAGVTLDQPIPGARRNEQGEIILTR
jgi:hypothetical protein